MMTTRAAYVKGAEEPAEWDQIDVVFARAMLETGKEGRGIIPEKEIISHVHILVLREERNIREKLLNIMKEEFDEIIAELITDVNDGDGVDADDDCGFCR